MANLFKYKNYSTRNTRTSFSVINRYSNAWRGHEAPILYLSIFFGCCGIIDNIFIIYNIFRLWSYNSGRWMFRIRRNIRLDRVIDVYLAYLSRSWSRTSPQRVQFLVVNLLEYQEISEIRFIVFVLQCYWWWLIYFGDMMAKHGENETWCVYYMYLSWTWSKSKANIL